jgi:hypothetical protein
MKALHVILPVISACLVLAAQGEWKKEGLVPSDTALRGQDAKIDEVPRIKWLTDFLALRDKSVPLKHITYWKHFNDDPTVQAELLNEFRSRFPQLLADAFKSSGNMHNPKVLPLRSKFSECLLTTPTLAQINVALLAQGYTVKRISFEKFEIDKEKKTTPFHAISWLIVEPIANEEAQQASTGQPATLPESKLEGGDKPQPEAEGRSR